jgi:hypothetical protein
MSLDERIRSAVASAHASVEGVAVTQHEVDLISSGPDQPPGYGRPHRFARAATRRQVAVATAVAVLLLVVAVPIWRAHSRNSLGPATPNSTNRVYHPALLAGLGSFRIDDNAAIDTDSTNVFFARWADLPSCCTADAAGTDANGVVFMRPQWVVDPATDAPQPVSDLVAWVQGNPRLKLGPPRSVTVAGDLAVQFDYYGTTNGKRYSWVCPEAARPAPANSFAGCFDIPTGGTGYITVVRHDGAQYLLYAAGAPLASWPTAQARFDQTLASWTWGQ